jgi:Fe-S-cluster containining protein
MDPNPCLSCGACCCLYRVSFHWQEGDDATPGGVPVALCEDLNSRMRVMRGTTSRANCRCIALLGTLGEQVACSIHPQRPSPCRAFPASWSEGAANLDCDRARASIGLPPLRPDDWVVRPDPEAPRPRPRRPRRAA